MDVERVPYSRDLLLPAQSEVVAARAYSKRCFQRILCAWVQDLLEHRRTTQGQIEISQKKVA